MGIAFRFAARSDVGRVRSKNDDSGYAGHYLAVVADGMGGHVGGDVASATTVLDLTPLDRAGFNGTAGVYLADEIQTANMIMNELVELNPMLGGMGTTCTALLIDGNKLELAHIGDSRAYRLRGGVFEQITTDHTFVQKLLEEGRISPEDAEHHPHRNVIMRVLGDVDASPELDLLTLDAEIGEKWLLSSDGLDSVVGVDEIEAIMRSTGDLKQITQTLVDLTLDRGAPDNVTVVTLAVIDEDSLSSTITAPQPIIPLKQYDDLGNPLPTSQVSLSLDVDTKQIATVGSGEQDGASPADDSASVTAGVVAGSSEVAESEHSHRPWRRRLPKEANPRNALRHGKWRGESFSDGVFNTMTVSSGVDERPEDSEDSSAAVLRKELDERPHQLVGAASNATNTGMIPAVTARTLEQRHATLVETSQLYTGEDAGVLPEELRAIINEPAPSVRSRWSFRVFAVALILGVLGASALTFFSWTSSQYYVGVQNEKVAIFSGIPQAIGPVELYSVVEETDLGIDSLPEYSRSLVHSTIRATDVNDAHRIVRDLKSQAEMAPSESASASPSVRPGTITTVEPSASASSSASEPSATATGGG